MYLFIRTRLQDISLHFLRGQQNIFLPGSHKPILRALENVILTKLGILTNFGYTIEVIWRLYRKILIVVTRNVYRVFILAFYRHFRNFFILSQKLERKSSTRVTKICGSTAMYRKSSEIQ